MLFIWLFLYLLFIGLSLLFFFYLNHYLQFSFFSLFTHPFRTKSQTTTISSNSSSSSSPFSINESFNVLIILGSGGHTMEMLQLLSTLTSFKNVNQFDSISITSRTFVIANNDLSSVNKLHQFQTTSTNQKYKDKVFFVPRARRVGQSWLSTPFTTFYAFLSSMKVVYLTKPKLILCNGPGTCIPICIAAKLLNILLFLRPLTRCFYIESIARVEHLSLSGLLFHHLRLGPMAVQWPILKLKYPRTKYKGFLV